MELPEKLIELRKKRGLSRREVADATGISENTYKKYEIPSSDKLSVRPSYERLCILADFFGVTTDYLLGREPVVQDITVSVEMQNFITRLQSLPLDKQNELIAMLSSLFQNE